MNKSPKSGTKRLIWIVLCIVIAIVLMRTYFRLTDDFRISNIQYDMPYHAEWEITPLTLAEDLQVKNILNQTFTYLGKGAQSYAFTSADQKYVLKFFKFKHLRPSFLVDMLPPIPPFKDYKENLAARKKRKLFGVFEGYRLAFDKDRAESGLIFIQLNPSHISMPVTLIDKIGLKRTVDLGTVAFILQEKGTTLRDTFKNDLERDDVAAVKQKINQIFDLYLSEYQKGIYDHDHGVMQNTGFIGNRPIHLDVGKLLKDEQIKQPEIYKADLIKVADKIKEWLCANYPQQCPEIVLSINERLSQIFGAPYTLK